MSNKIDHSAEGLDKIVCKIESIELAVVVNAESGMKTGCAEASCNVTSDNSVTVIKPAVDRIIGASVKPFVKGGKICFGSQCFLGIYVFLCDYRGVMRNFFCTGKTQNGQRSGLVILFFA